MYRVLLLAALAVGMTMADGTSSVRQFLLETNNSPKQRGGHGNIWDHIMVRGASGQLQSWSDRERQAMATSAVCEDCKIVVRYLAIAVKEGESLEKFKETFKLLCNLLDEQEQASCRNIIDNFDTIIEQLDPLLKNPQLFCQELSLCSTENVPRVVRLIVRWMAARTQGQVPANDVVCDECMFVVSQLRNILNERGTQDEIRGVFDKLCSYLGGSSGQKCVQIVDQYFPLVYDEIVALMADSRGLCIDVELCNNSAVHQRTRPSMMRLIPATIARRAGIRHSAMPMRQTPRLDASMRFLRRIQTRDGRQSSCVMCKVGWTALLAALKADKGLQQKLSDALRSLACDKILPQGYNLDCNDWLGLYLPSILYMTLEDIDPTQVCDIMKMCTKNESLAVDAMTAEERVTVLCQACTVTTEFLQHELNDRSMQDDIMHMIERECENFPGDMVQECKSLIDTYAPALFQTLVQELNPSVACPALHMCPQAANADVEDKETKDGDDM